MVRLASPRFSTAADLILDTCSEIQEVSVRIKNTRLRVVRWERLVPLIPDVHDVLRVALPNHETYALDLTGAQYGWHDSAVMPWEIFMEQRAKEIEGTRFFGKTTRVLRAEAEAAASNYVRLHRVWLEHMLKAFNNDLTDWQQDNVSFKILLRCSEEEFQRRLSSLMAFMEERTSELTLEANKYFKSMAPPA